MLEARISLCPDGDADAECRGDVRIVKLTGAFWTPFQRRNWQIVEWEDDDLETDMKRRGLAIRVLPYREDEDMPELATEIDLGNGKTHTVTPRRHIRGSNRYYDLDALDADTKRDVLDPSKEVAKLPHVASRQKTRPAKQTR